MANPELEKFRQQNPNLDDKNAQQLQSVRDQSQTKAEAQNPDPSKTASPDPARANQNARPDAHQPAVEPTSAKGVPDAYNQQTHGNPEMAKAQAQARESMQNDSGKDQIKQAEQDKGQEPER